MKDIVTNLVAALIYTALGFAVSRIWFYYRHRFTKEYIKISYYRVIRLRFRNKNDSPYYTRRHHTIKDKSDAVCDERWLLNCMQCTRPEKLSPVRITSSGIVDALQIMPILNRNADEYPHTRDNATMFTFDHQDPSPQLLAVGTLINRIQTPDNWWYAMSAQYDDQTLFLIMDFTSLPYENCPVRNVISSLERDGKTVRKETVAQQWFEEHVGPDLFYLRFKNAKKGDVIKFNFTIDIEATSRNKSEEVLSTQSGMATN